MADRFSLDEIKDLFRDDVMRFVGGMRAELEQLSSNPHDTAALDRLRGFGHSLKGSAGLVGLTYLSQAGEVVDRMSEVASGYAQTDISEALAIFRHTQAVLPLIERLLSDCLSGADPELQENLFTELFLTYPEHVRRYLRSLEATDTKVADAETRVTAPDTNDSSADEAWWAELADAFDEELRENLVRVTELVRELAAAPQPEHSFRDLSRVFHTIKGSAAMVGRSDLSDLARYLQDAFGVAAERRELTTESLATVQAAFDGVFAAVSLPVPPLPAVAPTRRTFETALSQDAELLEAFQLDAREALEASEGLLLRLETEPDNRDVLRSLLRHFHTLKGAAAAVGLETVAGQLHHGESLLDAVVESRVSLAGSKLTEFLFRLVDSVAALVQVSRGVSDTEHRVWTDVGAEVAALIGTAPAKKRRRSRTAAKPEGASAIEIAIPGATEGTGLVAAGAEGDGAVVRIQASRLDALMNQVTQLVVSRTRMDRKIESFGELRDKLDYCRRRLTGLIQGFQEHYEYTIGDRNDARSSSATSFAPEDMFTDLELDKYDDVNILARSVIELATDTGEIADQLGGLIESFGEESRQFSKITSSLQRQITRLRLVPLDNVFRRLVRPVRDAARQEGKVVDFRIEGGEVQLDKAIVEALHAPLLHLVRNAVSHGIELPATRQNAGKPGAGTLRISVQPRHNSVLIEVQDDGDGIDFTAVLAKARALGLAASDAVPTREQLLPLIFRPGFSTGERVTDLAGRGVGMDVVARDIAALNGSLLVDSKDREGTTIRMVLPTMTAIDEVLLLHAGQHCYALGTDFVEQAVAVDLHELVDVDGQRMLQVRNQLIPVLLLGPLVDQPTPPGPATALLLRAGERAMALVIDRVEPQREAVIRPLGRVLEAHPFLSGATISGDGTVIFTLHPGRLFDVLAAEAPRQATFLLEDNHDRIPARPKAILVVDDSISVRKLASRFLESEGIEVETAVDGLDALEKLSSGRFRAVVTDLEMPRMHGYELIAEIRRQPTLRDLPVVVCSSRSSDKHRARAREVGAQGYLTKPFTQEQLVAELQLVAGALTPMALQAAV